MKNYFFFSTNLILSISKMEILSPVVSSLPGLYIPNLKCGSPHDSTGRYPPFMSFFVVKIEIITLIFKIKI